MGCAFQGSPCQGELARSAGGVSLPQRIGFPYEGKLSPEATDEVDSAA